MHTVGIAYSQLQTENTVFHLWLVESSSDAKPGIQKANCIFIEKESDHMWTKQFKLLLYKVSCIYF